MRPVVTKRQDDTVNTDTHESHRSSVDDEAQRSLLSPSARSLTLSVDFTDDLLSPTHSTPNKVYRYLYASHALARWAWRTWEFSVALILMQLHPESLLLVSAYGLLDNLVRLLLGSYIGQYIDRSDRLHGAVSCYGVQNICIATSAAAAGVLVWIKDHHQAALTPTVYWSLLGVSIVTGASSSIGSLGAAVAVEREYPKILCGANTLQLSRVNSVMRAIDLSSQMLAPVVAGFLMTYSSMITAISVQALYCVGVWLPECLLLSAAHHVAPVLRTPKVDQIHHPSSRKPHPLSVLLGYSGWQIYFQQSTLLPGLALALLYLTVLSLGFLMTSYLAWRGMSEATLSLFRAAGALSGLLATAVFHPLQRYLGLVTSGTIGICWQLICLLLGVTPVVITHMTDWQGPDLHDLRTGAFIANNDTSVTSSGTSQATADSESAGNAQVVVLYMLLCGLVASRLGLWLFDLVVSQLQQEQVPDNQLGTVSGVQNSIQSFFEILSFVAGCIIHKPEQFHWLMSGSCAAVLAAGGLYLIYCSQQWRRAKDTGAGASSRAPEG